MKKVAPSVAKELSTQMPELDPTKSSVFNQPKVASDSFMKHMDTSLEVFFFKRNYNQDNFAFYL